MNGKQRIRELVKSVYMSKKWWSKVDTMNDNQVSAIYLRLIKEGML